MNDIDEYLNCADEEAIRFTGLDEAVVGYDHRGLLVYDYYKMLSIFKRDMTEDEAIEWIDYNVIGTNAGMGFTVIYQ